MTQKDTPDWIKNLDQPLKDTKEYPSEVDTEILEELQKLSFEELDRLANTSGVRDYLGVLIPPAEWSRDQYIEVLSDISEMTEGQIRKIRAYLNITR